MGPRLPLGDSLGLVPPQPLRQAAVPGPVQPGPLPRLAAVAGPSRPSPRQPQPPMVPPPGFPAAALAGTAAAAPESDLRVPWLVARLAAVEQALALQQGSVEAADTTHGLAHAGLAGEVAQLRAEMEVVIHQQAMMSSKVAHMELSLSELWRHHGRTKIMEQKQELMHRSLSALTMKHFQSVNTIHQDIKAMDKRIRGITNESSDEEGEPADKEAAAEPGRGQKRALALADADGALADGATGAGAGATPAGHAKCLGGPRVG